ncbi:SDR family NAD(P)-dependent oxidoreductase [Candidatus Fukatsuia endosymbiont of Tuberolachnus salignus]|uniref:SDR family NAD(P)-dependent oxidoreductase n=1 Tax=Candidatus Fukatsuia endosymbiont of Tuberolachnus salignus TaxID=3077957 RepID=UPI00313B9D18
MNSIPEVHHNTKKLKAYNIQPSTQRVELFTCSAQTEKALKALLGSYQKHLLMSEANLNDICFNAGKYRSTLNHHIAITATDKQDCINKINAFLEGDILSGVEYFSNSRKTPRLGFIFTGQGPQWYAMGRELIAKEPLFRKTVEDIDELFLILSGWSLLEEMNRSKVESNISDTRIAQPAIMAIQIALVELWKQYGIEPAGLVGHSIGEVAAAYASGALNMEQAVTVIYHRSRGQHQAAGKGLMLAIGLSKVEAEKLIADVSDVVSIAAVNGPESITLSGDKKPLDAIAKQLTARDIFNRFLKVDVPFHSHHMDPLKEELISSLQDLRPIETNIPLYSTVTGKQENGTHLDANYWYNNLRDPVYFSHALEQMIQDGFDLYVEVGPHPALSNGAEELFAKLGCNARIFPSIRRQEDEALRFKQTLGALHVAGLPLDWDKICPNAHRLHDLPRYPWQQQSFWHETRSHQAHRLQCHYHPHIIQHHNSGLSQDVHNFRIFLDGQADPYIKDHTAAGLIIFPGTGHLELATAAAQKAFGSSFCFLENINFENGLFLPHDGEAPEIRLEIYSNEGRYWLMSLDNEEDVAYSGCYEYRWQPAKDFDLYPTINEEVLLIGDASYQHDLLLETLSDAGMKIVTLGEAPKFYRPVHLQDREKTLKAFEEIKSAYPDLNRMVITLPLGQTGEDSLSERIETLAWKILNINNAIIKNEWQGVIWTLTHRLEKVLPDDKCINLIQSPIYGLNRVMTNESPMAMSKIVDLGSADKQELQSLITLFNSTTHGNNESELAIRGDKLFAKRLEKVNPHQAQEDAHKVLMGSGSYYEAFFTEQGLLDSVRFRQIAPPILGEYEVEIAVKSAALNFKDILNGTGLLSTESITGGLCGDQLGLECSGIVTRTGSSVSRFKEGDEVLAMAPRSIAGIAVTPEHCIVKKPSQLSFEQAAAIPVVYLTAYHCLCKLADIKKGERLLIHSATGGVGMAAIRLAQEIGVEIFATIGNADEDKGKEKRDILRAMNIQHVYDSRKLDFYHQIMADTNNQGVDVVLNSLSGDAITQSLKCLRPYGRFIEIGKTDIYQDAALYLKRFGENLSYFAVDIDRLMAQKPERGAALFAEIIKLFEKGSLKPHHINVFPITQLSAALNHLAKSQQIGKVVLNMEGHTVHALPPANLVLDPEKVYIITGGASGLGIELAKWLVEKGAKKLMLVSRSGPKMANDWLWIKTVQTQKIDIFLPEIDLISPTEVAQMIAQAKTLGTIGGVIHGAAVMQNAMIEHLGRETFAHVFSAKAMGAWNLHQALQGEAVDFFLLISSISSVFGFAGQANYSAANNFLDKLVYYRHLQGLTAQSVNFGALGKFAGMSRDAGTLINILENQGWASMTQQQITHKIERILLEGNIVRMAANIDWLRFRQAFEHLRTDQRFAHLLTDAALNLNNKTGGDQSLRSKLQTVVAEEAQHILVEHFTDTLARLLGTVVDKIDPGKSLSAMGIDSLNLAQLRNSIQQKLGINYSLMRLVKGPSIVELAEQIREELSDTTTETPVSNDGDSSGITIEQDIEVINRWFVRLKRKEGEPPKKIKLFMIHSMGAAASMFADFMYHPPFECEVYAVQLPGREHRINEEVYTELTPLLSSLEEALIPLLDGDFAIYGHSYGGIIAFELCRLLREKHNRFPLQLFISATIAPQLTPDWKARQVMRETTNRNYSDQQLIDMMPRIMSREYLLTILEGMRRDMPLLNNYDYQECDPFPFPIRTFSAIEDDVTFLSEMKPWALLTLLPKDQIEVHGDHWLLSRKENRELVGKQISDDLRNLK